MPWKYNNKTIRAGRAWTNNDGVQHPANWMIWSDEQKTAAGLAFSAAPATYDSRFYWDANTPKNIADVNEVDNNGEPVLGSDGKQIVTLGLKSQWKAITKERAAGLLAPTDWYVVRKAEDSTTTIPSDVSTYRASVRTKSGQIEAAIDGAANHAAFLALFDATFDDLGNQTAPAPVNDWPDEL